MQCCIPEDDPLTNHQLFESGYVFHSQFLFSRENYLYCRNLGQVIQLAAKLVDSGSGATLPEIVDIYFANDDVPFLDTVAWDQ